MIRRLLNEEHGYSLVEVVASIIILSLAILPMVGMFDMGLQSATRGSNYDKARTLANLKMEEAKSLPFDTLRDNFPEVAPTTTPYDGSGNYQSDLMTDEGELYWDETFPPGVFEYSITKQYMAQPPTDSDADPADAVEDYLTCPNLENDCTPPTDLIRVTVTVQWGGNTYTTYGLVAR